jgi:hypothetical protein
VTQRESKVVRLHGYGKAAIQYQELEVIALFVGSLLAGAQGVRKRTAYKFADWNFLSYGRLA